MTHLKDDAVDSGTPETVRKLRPDPLRGLLLRGLIGQEHYDAALAIAAAVRLIAGGAGLAVSDPSRLPGGGAGRVAPERLYDIRLQEDYRAWTAAMAGAARQAIRDEAAGLARCHGWLEERGVAADMAVRLVRRGARRHGGAGFALLLASMGGPVEDAVALCRRAFVMKQADPLGKCPLRWRVEPLLDLCVDGLSCNEIAARRRVREALVRPVLVEGLDLYLAVVVERRRARRRAG